jgi:hypothetical protein
MRFLTSSSSGDTETTSTNASLALGTNNFTVEYWLYISTAGGGNVAVSSGNGVATYDGLFGYQTGSGVILYLSSNGSSWDIASGVTIGSTPTGTWNHIAITRSGNTFRTFVNGVQGATFTSSASIYQSANSFVLGRAQNGAGLIGNISNMRVVVGTALYTSNFVPSTSALAAVTNTKLLTLQDATIIDNSTNALTFTNTGSVVTATATPFANPTIGSDASGNANNWQPNNINVTTTGVTYDSMIDVPTPYADGDNGRGNYCVINPLDVSASTVSSGNLNITFATNSDTNRAATFGVSSGKWYWETTITAVGGTYSIVGITSGASTATALGTSSYQYAYISSTGNKFNNGSSVAYGATYTTGDVIGIALDMDAGTLVFYKNNSSQGTAYTGLSGTFFPAFNARNASNNNANFGQRPFSYTPPSGFVALNTQNLPTPTISNGATVMAATTYTGTVSALTVANTVGSASFQPDLVWVKGRSGATDHALYDSVRGTTKDLVSNSTAAETTQATGLTAFGSTGFTIGALAKMNTNTATYVGWQWKETPSAGFDIVACATNGSGIITATSHNLGVVPSMIILKALTGTDSWYVYHKNSTATPTQGTLQLNATGAVNTTNGSSGGVDKWTVSSSTFAAGNAAWTYQASTNNIAYLFAAVAGYSAFGSYTGNNLADGPFVYLGFRPRFIMFKDASANGVWMIMDTARNTYNVLDDGLAPNNANAESSYSNTAQVDFLSNGFKIRATNANQYWNNISGNTIIYAAFAESPFRNSLAF